MHHSIFEIAHSSFTLADSNFAIIAAKVAVLRCQMMEAFFVPHIFGISRTFCASPEVLEFPGFSRGSHPRECWSSVQLHMCIAGMGQNQSKQLCQCFLGALGSASSTGDSFKKSFFLKGGKRPPPPRFQPHPENDPFY